MNAPLLDLTGGHFGKLTAIEFAYRRKRHAYWRCRCDCGREKIAAGTNLIGGKATSCGECGIKRKARISSLRRNFYHDPNFD